MVAQNQNQKLVWKTYRGRERPRNK